MERDASSPAAVGVGHISIPARCRDLSPERRRIRGCHRKYPIPGAVDHRPRRTCPDEQMPDIGRIEHRVLIAGTERLGDVGEDIGFELRDLGLGEQPDKPGHV